MDSSRAAAMLEEGRSHLRFCAELYRRQLRDGRHFLHEHPSSAISRREPEIDALVNSPEVFKVVWNKCQFGLTTKSADGKGRDPAMKAPRFLITSQRFYEVQSHLSTTGHVFAVYMPVISQPFFNSLSDEHKELVRTSMASARAHQAELVSAEEASQLEEIRAAGVEVLELTAEQRQAFADATEGVRLQYRDEVGAEAYDAWIAAVAAASGS